VSARSNNALQDHPPTGVRDKIRRFILLQRLSRLGRVDCDQRGDRLRLPTVQLLVKDTDTDVSKVLGHTPAWGFVANLGRCWRWTPRLKTLYGDWALFLLIFSRVHSAKVYSVSRYFRHPICRSPMRMRSNILILSLSDLIGWSTRSENALGG
jgi:hypothetical protein